MSPITHVQARICRRAAAVVPAIAVSFILITASPSLAAQPALPGSAARAAPPGSGAPPRSFWGNTGAIPPATHVLEVEVINRTNGRFPSSRVYWSFNGREKSIARQRYIDMPANSAGRMYFYLGSPHSKYFDFIEFTVGPSSINVDTTRVDRFGLQEFDPSGPNIARVYDWLKADDSWPGSSGFEQAADVSGITGHDVGVQLRCGVRNHSVHHVTGTSLTQEIPGRVCVLLGKNCDLAATQQSTQLHLVGGTADLCDDRSRDDRDDPGQVFRMAGRAV
jgi:hypothetical protein